MSHLCHARNCREEVPPRMFACRKHWFMLPKRLRDQIWSHYVPGQERRKDPTEAYLTAAQAAIDYLAAQEEQP